jgi:hypothetical protein
MPTDEHASRGGPEASSVDAAKATAATETTPRVSSLWGFANSSFGIFLFTSVLLGLVSFSYTRWQAYEGDRRTIEQLDLEIALRLDATDKMASSKENIRYSNLVNINDVINGAVKSSFYVRKPLFNEFENKSLTTLMWQLYLLVPLGDKNEIKDKIRKVNDIMDRIAVVRFNAANELDDTRPKPKTKKEQDKRDDEDDKFKKEYGQTQIYNSIHALTQVSRWKALMLSGDGKG